MEEAFKGIFAKPLCNICSRLQQAAKGWRETKGYRGCVSVLLGAELLKCGVHLACGIFNRMHCGLWGYVDSRADGAEHDEGGKYFAVNFLCILNTVGC